MTLVTIAPGQELAPEAAASYARARAAGAPPGVTSSTRTRAQQASLYAAYRAGGALASLPGTSDHEEPRARALDLPEPARSWPRWPEFGWVRTNGEPWHRVYLTSADQHLNDSTPTESEPDMVIYRSTAPGNRFGVLAHNGGFVVLASDEEFNNIMRNGGREVWVNPDTLDNLIADARSH
jgi:hypothetical protein